MYTGVGQPVCAELEKIGIPKDRITYILNGVNIRQFRPQPNKLEIRKRFGIPKDDIVLLSVGRITYQKQPLTLVEVFSYIERENSDVTLCIAGKGELLGAAKEMAHKKGLKKVFFLGYIDDRDLPDLYACSDYYIMTSNYEGGMPPLTLAEAMASGLPCIVSDIPSLRIVREADCGIVVSFDDIHQASYTILEYLSSDHIENASHARDYALEHLDWKSIAKTYENAFLQYINH
jgi:glycosyltransferase involved in cell wall biosynthesis